MPNRFVSVIMGSKTDLPLLRKTVEVFKNLKVDYEMRVFSAHRTPEALVDYMLEAESRGCAVYIAAAGMAAHLAGAVAARTLCPVIGVPCPGGILDGVDALYSTVQMPGGIPVATVAVGAAGAKNAAYLAAQILALGDGDLLARLEVDRRAAAQKVLEADRAVLKEMRELKDE